MKVVIAGSRNVSDFTIVNQAIAEAGFDISEVVSGTARGVDYLGEYWAEQNRIPIKRFRADWSKGKFAGVLRNAQMAEYADALIAIWDGKSPGTKNMISVMKKLGKPAHVKNVGKAAALLFA